MLHEMLLWLPNWVYHKTYVVSHSNEEGKRPSPPHPCFRMVAAIDLPSRQQSHLGVEVDEPHPGFLLVPHHAAEFIRFRVWSSLSPLTPLKGKGETTPREGGSLQGGFPDPLALSQNGSDQTLDPPKPPWVLTTT